MPGTGVNAESMTGIVLTLKDPTVQQMRDIKQISTKVINPVMIFVTKQKYRLL